ncbi:MAG: hypothetical protein EU541_05180 [Promethearchaeota archaeon]|nr:MAG: hypothetical protein EU541_05180 [Candidatus Lokiarchaeota archaeon]
MNKNRIIVIILIISLTIPYLTITLPNIYPTRYDLSLSNGTRTPPKMDISLSDANASFIGEEAHDWSGRSLSGLGDINGDGYDDFAIASSRHDNSKGKVYIFLGKESGFSMELNLSEADVSFIGEKDIDWAGWSITGAGDVNNDSYDDIIIGAYQANSSRGKVYLIFGKNTGWKTDVSLSVSNASYVGEISSDQAGFSVSSAGDINGDDFDDILIGAPQYGSFQGRTYLIYGKTSGWLNNIYLSNANASFTGEASLDMVGSVVSSAGDVNNDTYSDILIGSNLNDEGGVSSGKVYLFFGSSSGYIGDLSVSKANASFIGENPYDFAGTSIAGVGDVNGDDFDDILIGANNFSEIFEEGGKAYLIFGRETNLWINGMHLSNANASFVSESLNNKFGTSAARVGDVNNDTYNDILIGAYFNSEGGPTSGQTYLILGKETGWNSDISISNADGSFIGEENGDYSGYCVSGAGDVNNDGYDDILIGAYNNDEGGTSAGKSYLFLDFDTASETNGGNGDTSIPGYSIFIILFISIISLISITIKINSRNQRK